jgi:hypothetical protein
MVLHRCVGGKGECFPSGIPGGDFSEPIFLLNFGFCSSDGCVGGHSEELGGLLVSLLMFVDGMDLRIPLDSPIYFRCRAIKVYELLNLSKATAETQGAGPDETTN